MLAMILAAALSPPELAARHAWCTMIRERTVATAAAKIAGKTELVARAETFVIGDPEVRSAQQDIITMAYTGNADDGVTPKALGSITFQACMAED